MRDKNKRIPSKHRKILRRFKKAVRPLIKRGLTFEQALRESPGLEDYFKRCGFSIE